MKSFIKTILPETFIKLLYVLPKGDPFKIMVLFLLMMVAALLEVVGIGMIPAFVAIIADPEQVLQVEWLQPLLQMLEVSNGKDLLIWGSVALVGVFIVKSAYIIAFNYFEAHFIYNRRYLISHRLMSTYMQAPYTFHLQRNTAELLRNITREVNVLVSSVVTNFLKIAREGVMTISIVIFLFLVEPLITVIVLSLSGVGVGTFLFFTQKKLKQYGKEEQARYKTMYQAVNQGLGGIKDARVLNREKEFIDRFRIEAFETTRLMAYMKFIKQIPKPVVETTAVIGMMLIAALMVWQGRAMSAIIPILTLFAMATVRLMPSIQSISSKYTSLRYKLVSIDPIYDDLKDLEEYRNNFLSDREKKNSLQLNNNITVEDVQYHYPESKEQAVNGVSFTIPRGKSVAFVGQSGAGKTTMVDLLLGVLEPTGGVIKVDGKNIQESLSAWQRNIGYIPQSIYLTDESLRCNIAYGLPEHEIDDRRVKQAVRLAQLESTVGNMPNGVDTMIGEHGTRISGGQRQRVGIARALYHDPQVLIMDEATSALDNITEKQITDAINAIKGDRTVVMIAHRLTTVEKCDVIYLMKGGAIVDSGSYEELVAGNEEFRKMAMSL